MEIEVLTKESGKWRAVAEYAQCCPWRAGKELAEKMLRGGFTGWERVIAAMEGDRIAGYCAVTKTDCIPGLAYTPYIGFVFVDESCRGIRLSQKMIICAMGYLESLGFAEVYLISDHVGLYEKYGFTGVDRQIAPWGREETIYRQKLG